MSWRHLLTGCLLVIAFSTARSQSYLGSWTLDWSQVLDTAKFHSPLVLMGLDQIEEEAGSKVVWIFGESNLRIVRDGNLLSEANIKWTKNDEFIITRPKKPKTATHFIDPVSEGKIRIRSDYDVGEIYLKKL